MEILGNLYLDIKLYYRYLFYRQTYRIWLYHFLAFADLESMYSCLKDRRIKI